MGKSYLLYSLYWFFESINPICFAPIPKILKK